MNPYHRDGLFNYALMQINNEEFPSAISIVDRLIAIDPSNPDNFRLYVYAYNGIRKAQLAKAKAFGDTVNALAASKKAADIAHRKALIDSAAKMDPLQRASLNQIVAWNTKADSMPVKVAFTEFTSGAQKTTLSGRILNRTPKEQTYTINVEFLDKDGKGRRQGKGDRRQGAARTAAGASPSPERPGNHRVSLRAVELSQIHWAVKRPPVVGGRVFVWGSEVGEPLRPGRSVATQVQVVSCLR